MQDESARDRAIEKAKLKGGFEKDLFTLGYDAGAKQALLQVADEADQLWRGSMNSFDVLYARLKTHIERIRKEATND